MISRFLTSSLSCLHKKWTSSRQWTMMRNTFESSNNQKMAPRVHRSTRQAKKLWRAWSSSITTKSKINLLIWIATKCSYFSSNSNYYKTNKYLLPCLPINSCLIINSSLRRCYLLPLQLLLLLNNRRPSRYSLLKPFSRINQSLYSSSIQRRLWYLPLQVKARTDRWPRLCKAKTSPTKTALQVKIAPTTYTAIARTLLSKT